jgi:cobalt-precorrin 5A hydrolase
VKKTTGLGNICERAAVFAAGDGALLLVKKQAEQGVTVAVALQVNL